MHVVGEHQHGVKPYAMEDNNVLVMKQQTTVKQHVSDMSLHHLDMHECDSNSNALHATSDSSQTGITKIQHDTKPMKFVDETLNVKKKIKKKQFENTFKRSKLRKSLSNKTFLENYFEYDDINGTNQLKKFKLIESSHSKIVTSEIIPDSNASSMHVSTSENNISENSSSSHSYYSSNQVHESSIVLESGKMNETNDNINLLLALLFVLTGDSQNV